MTENNMSDEPAVRQRFVPVKAIAARKAIAAANRKRIADAIASLARGGQPVNVRSVARAAGVHPDTVRRSGDLYEEVRRHRNPTPHLSAGVSQAQPSMDRVQKARLLDAHAEISELRRDLAATRRALHQALGEAGTVIDFSEAERLHQVNAEQAAIIIELQDRVRALTDERQQLVDELTATREVNREYLRDLNHARTQLQRGRGTS
ncbi:hypothetical protein [Nocardioides sp. CER19]|uniref:hypothetical protein n=1 Tax=Nocardioides sp. CER19 TaxID=3038538 RepID=UPI00244D71F1|nr:hypothetical protein [Nocardioides sp. CER19]MDH2413940.1 hypothetical protein [Nocardioides sp. CER19]